MNARFFIASFVVPCLAAALLGCSPDLAAVTVPPPGAVAELDSTEDTIELTRGIALGFECAKQGRPCGAATAEVEDASVASVFPAYVDLLNRDHGNALPTGEPRTVFVLVGNQPGNTTLNISSDDGDVSYGVTILDR